MSCIFRELGTSNTIALVGALAAVVMATLAFIKAFGRERKVNKLILDDMQDRLDSKKKATLEVHSAHSKRYGIVIYNTGESAAKNIRVQIVGTEEENGLFLLIAPDMFPYPFLHKGGSFGLISAVAETHKPIVCIKLIWDDDYAENREKETIVNLL